MNFLSSFHRPRRTQATSVEAHEANQPVFKNMGDRIVAYMQDHGETRTRAEIAQALGVSTSTMSGRIRALLDANRLIEEPGRFKCSVTKNMVRGVSVA